MNTLAAFTSYNAVRSALGVSSSELKDDVLDERLFLFVLRKELLAISPNIITDYKIVNASRSKTVAEQAFHEMFYVFCTYSVARHCLNSLPLFSPKTIIEDKSALTRHSESPFKTTIMAVTSMYAEVALNLTDAYSVYTGGAAAATVALPFMRVVTPSYDPVTGE